ncbi:TPA: 50S ribosomal protein L24 [Candidatus Woesearchaeota archaeon]|nr:50S ribosomal protein L24P [uncultured archaeon]HIH11922.1 50S ribosomal protein L24 [Candidatus Woesearchaeota archaeon]
MEKKKSHSVAWKTSTQPRKQRKYLYNAPLHLRQKLIHAHLSKELRLKYGRRSAQVRQGDHVKLVRGQHRNKEGKVEHVDLKEGSIFVAGLDFVKKDGSKVPLSIAPSNVVVTVLDLADKKRKQKFEFKSTIQTQKTSTPSSTHSNTVLEKKKK